MLYLTRKKKKINVALHYCLQCVASYRGLGAEKWPLMMLIDKNLKIITDAMLSMLELTFLIYLKKFPKRLYH